MTLKHRVFYLQTTEKDYFDMIELFNSYNQEYLKRIYMVAYKESSKDLGRIYMYKRNSELVYDVIIIRDQGVEKVQKGVSVFD